MWKRPSVLPGFGPALGYTLFYLSLIVLLPLAGLVLRPVELGWSGFWHAVSAPRVLAALRLSFGAAFIAASINAVIGLVIAWALERYRFPARRIIDALVDLPFALPTAVAGIALTSLYAPNGWLGSQLEPLGIKVAFSPVGVVVAMVFIGLPFVVRTVQPVLLELDREMEEAAASLGASRFAIFRRIIFPNLLPAILSGVALAFARAVGEFGAVVLISGNLPFKTEVASVYIFGRLGTGDTAGAAALSLVLLLISFAVLLAVGGLRRWATRHDRPV
ncbi:MAG TPA: sulfate ABC transporter permease subunit CysT [Dongiaceae bacterium]|nr:sulfate ABC transporter permease subunit CysT [Dongiaceae bacterium]